MCSSLSSSLTESLTLFCRHISLSSLDHLVSHITLLYIDNII